MSELRCIEFIEVSKTKHHNRAFLLISFPLSAISFAKPQRFSKPFRFYKKDFHCKSKGVRLLVIDYLNKFVMIFMLKANKILHLKNIYTCNIYNFSDRKSKKT